MFYKIPYKSDKPLNYNNSFAQQTNFSPVSVFYSNTGTFFFGNCISCFLYFNQSLMEIGLFGSRKVLDTGVVEAGEAAFTADDRGRTALCNCKHFRLIFCQLPGYVSPLLIIQF